MDFLRNVSACLGILLTGVILITSEINTLGDDGGPSINTVIEDILLPQQKISHFPGENVEIASLKVTYNFEDVRIPGANGMDIVVGRKYNGGPNYLVGFGKQYFKVPSITVFEDAAANTLPQQGYGCVTSKLHFTINFQMPDDSMTTVGFPDSSYLPPGTLMAFANNSVFKCEGALPVVLRPNGTKITYAKQVSWYHNVNGTVRERRYSFASSVEDRFGNIITYNYGDDYQPSPLSVPRPKIISISRNDGARVYFEHQERGVDLNKELVITKVYYGDRDVRYTYVRPFNSTYTVENSIDQEGRTTHFDYILHGKLQKISLPTTASAEYTYQTFNPDLGLNGQLKWKKITGPDLPTRIFTYLYNPSGQYLYHADIIQTESDALDGEILETIYTVKNRPMGSFYANDEQALHTVTNGTLKQLLIKKGGSPQISGGEIIYSLHNEWAPVRHGSSGCGKRTQSNGRYKVCARARLNKQVKHVFNGVGQTSNAFTTDPYSFDQYGFVKYSKNTSDYEGSAGLARYTRQTYLHDKTNWIIGLPRVTYKSENGSSWAPVYSRSYHSATGAYKSSLAGEYQFGRWSKKYTGYYGTGELSTVIYNDSDRVEKFLNYKRGKAQEIQLPKFSSAGMKSRFEYVDDYGNVVQSIDFRGNSTSYRLDKLNRQVDVNFPGSAWHDKITTYNDDQRFELTSVSNKRSYRYYDGLGRTVLTRVEDITQPHTTKILQKFVYNKQGFIQFKSFPSKANPVDGTTYNYDALGRKVLESTANTNTTRRWEYLSGHRVRSIDGLDNETTLDYQAFGSPHYKTPLRIKQTLVPESVIIDPDDPPCDPLCAVGVAKSGLTATPSEQIVTLIHYDQFDNVSRVVQDGQTTNYVYDNFKKLCKISQNDIGDTAMEYDAAGQMMWSMKGATGSSTACGSNSSAGKVNYLYNKHGRLHMTTDNSGQIFQLFGHDEDGNVLGTLAFQGNDLAFSTYAYNDRNQPIIEHNRMTGAVVRWGYDANGNLSHTIYPTGLVVDYAPNALGQATKAGDFAHSVKFHATGGINEFSYGNQIKRTVAREKSGRINDIIDTYGPSDRFVHYYDFDSEHNLLNLYDAFQPAYDLTELKYDSANRLTKVNGIWGPGAIDYDDMGNITKLALGSHVNNYHYDEAKQLISISGANAKTFSYDEKGNVTNNGLRSFNYDAQNQMVESGSLLMSYDAFGHRISKRNQGNSTNFNYSQSGQLYSKTTSDGITTDYIYLNGGLIAQQVTNGSNSMIAYLHTDSLGSVSAESNATGTITKRYHYEPHGKVIEPGQIDDPGFTGQLYDHDLGLNYMRARYYDPSVGRFYSQDPVGFNYTNPASFNRYAYANNNPYKYVDINGESPTAPLALIGAGVGAAFGFVTSTYTEVTNNDGAFRLTNIVIATGKGALIGAATGGAGVGAGAAVAASLGAVDGAITAAQNTTSSTSDIVAGAVAGGVVDGASTFIGGHVGGKILKAVATKTVSNTVAANTIGNITSVAAAAATQGAVSNVSNASKMLTEDIQSAAGAVDNIVDRTSNSPKRQRQ